MSDPHQRCWPAAKIQRRLRVDEALIEMVGAERVFLASREQLVAKTHAAEPVSRDSSRRDYMLRDRISDKGLTAKTARADHPL
jgi:hypothetical protein